MKNELAEGIYLWYFGQMARLMLQALDQCVDSTCLQVASVFQNTVTLVTI